MSLLPDLQSLRAAADAVDRGAASVEAHMAAVARLVEAVPWHGPMRERVASDARRTVGVGRGQAGAERALARALRQLAAEVEHELQLLAALAAQARRHLEDLLHQANAAARATADAVAAALARGVTRIVVDIMGADPLAALHEAEGLAQRALDRVGMITVRLAALPPPADPTWHHLGPEILGWRPA